MPGTKTKKERRNKAFANQWENESPATRSASPGEIRPESVYSLPEAKARTGWSRQAYDEARKRGLKTRKSGKRIFLLGSELIEFLMNDGPVANSTSSN
jgi:hypothetical protein